MNSIQPGTRCFSPSRLPSLTLLVATKMNGPGMIRPLCRRVCCRAFPSAFSTGRWDGRGPHRTAEFLPVTVRTEDPLGPGDGHRVRGGVVPSGCGVGIDDGPV